MTSPSRINLSGLTLRFLSFSADSPNHNLPTNGPYIWSPEPILCATCTTFRSGSVPGASGAAVGPEGLKIDRTIWGQICIFILPEARPVVGCRAPPVWSSAMQLGLTAARAASGLARARSLRGPTSCTRRAWRNRIASHRKLHVLQSGPELGAPGPAESLDFLRAHLRHAPRPGRQRWRTTSATLRARKGLILNSPCAPVPSHT